MLLGWLVGRYGGEITLYDVFGQIPAPTQIDGERAQQRYAKILHREDQGYYGNIPNLRAVILNEISSVCPRERIEVVQGRYEDVLPLQTASKAFDLVHVDCDWYESSRVVLAYLKDHLSPGAILQIDDYDHWQGMRQAFDEAGWLNRYQARPADDALIVDTGKNKVGMQ
jgi:asparagine synthase (glutamine-hydrolysing)